MMKMYPFGLRLLTLSLIIFTAMSSLAFSDPKIKQPNVSGQFYDANPKRLSANIDRYFNEAAVDLYDKSVDILIAPHAGYVYSGGVAAYSFKAVSHQKYKTIVILAPSHYVGFDGISIWPEGGFQTPLGLVEVDDDFSKQLIAADSQFYFASEAFEKEHSLEVELPFLQKTFSEFKIVPVIMGQPTYETLDTFAGALKKIIDDRKDVLIVVSTDLSHYHDDTKARNMDRRTIEAVKAQNVKQLWKECRLRTMEMCGYVPVTAALLYAQKAGLTNVDILRYANSGDVSGDTDRVVGYSAITIYGGASGADKNSSVLTDEAEIKSDSELTSTLSFSQKKRLLDMARQTINQYIRDGKKLKVENVDPRLAQPEGAFVTLHRKGHLRGCIGRIIGAQPLYLTVRDMAISAATADPRFPQVKPEELDEIDVEVSVLSEPREIDDVADIKLGIHGVIISRGLFHSGVFLPQVADETGWTKSEFLSQLCSQKAGLPPDAWKDPKTKIEIFTADVFSERDYQ